MRPLFSLAALLAPLALAAQPAAPSLQSLVGNSPFGVANQPGNTPAASGAPLEFRGTFVDGGERFFSLVDTASRRAEWVSLNEADRPYVVRSYDPDQETIAVEHQGRTLNLKLHAAKIGALPPMQAAAQPAAPSGAPGTPGQVASPSATEAQRLAQVAEEIRRRRALRQQSANPQNAQPAGQPPPQPPRQP